MDELNKLLFKGFEFGQQKLDEQEKSFEVANSKINDLFLKAKESLMLKQAALPKPAKRPMRRVEDNIEEDDEEEGAYGDSSQNQTQSHTRPLRTAKTKNVNYKEQPLNTKQRNDKNVVVKNERASGSSKRVKSLSTSNKQLRDSSESIKENQAPDVLVELERLESDEGIVSGTESMANKRSESVEMITAKVVEVDITSGDEIDKMPPPPVPKKVTKARTKQKKPNEELVAQVQPQCGQLRVTRSKIKQEKLSNDQALPPVPMLIDSRVNDTVNKKASKKKYPMPLVVKVEPQEPVEPEPMVMNNTFNVEPQTSKVLGMNEAASTGAIAIIANETVTIDKNPNDSLMTEDNDEDEDLIPLSKINAPKPARPPMPLNLKKNEVFNPYMQSPVKQRVQAFEKVAVSGTTPDKYKPSGSKFNTLKAGTPSKIASLYPKVTPSSIIKTHKIVPPVPSSAPSGSKTLPKPYKKMNSMSQESLDETKKTSNVLSNLFEEKRRQREEKQRQAQIQREALEKEKREQAIKMQLEREEKHRKLMKEKEEKLRMEALKKKLQKDKQAKKYAEERAKKDEFVVPKPVDVAGSSKDDSLHLKLQRQILNEKAEKQKKVLKKDVYGFDILETDDSTDDESRPSVKRPPMPAWSKKSQRKPVINMQSWVNPNVLDRLFSVQPISVNLREIFPEIDSRKLVRNSSAVWRTPPKNYNVKNYL